MTTYTDECAALPAHKLAIAVAKGGGTGSGRVLLDGQPVATFTVEIGTRCGTVCLTSPMGEQRFHLMRFSSPRGGWQWRWALEGRSAATLYGDAIGQWGSRTELSLLYRSQARVHRARKLARWARRVGVWKTEPSSHWH